MVISMILGSHSCTLFGVTFICMLHMRYIQRASCVANEIYLIVCVTNEVWFIVCFVFPAIEWGFAVISTSDWFQDFACSCSLGKIQ